MRDSLRSLVAEMVRRDIPLEMATKEFERLFLEEVLAYHEGNQSAAARYLGIHRNTLSKKLDGLPGRLPKVREGQEKSSRVNGSRVNRSRARATS